MKYVAVHYLELFKFITILQFGNFVNLKITQELFWFLQKVTVRNGYNTVGIGKKVLG